MSLAAEVVQRVSKGTLIPEDQIRAIVEMRGPDGLRTVLEMLRACIDFYLDVVLPPDTRELAGGPEKSRRIEQC